MLERLEGIVKVKDQQKFNVRSARFPTIVQVASYLSPYLHA